MEYRELAAASIISLLVLVGILLSPHVEASPAPAEDITVGNSESWSPPFTANVSTVGGNVTQLNVTGKQVTDKWAGIWGNISGDVILADSSGHQFYQWTVNDVTGSVVYAANDTVSDWGSSNIAVANQGNMPSYLVGDAVDNYTQTFASKELFDGPSFDISDARYVKTFDEADNPTFKTYSLKEQGTSTLIWAGKANDSETAFNDKIVDYQLLVPAEEGTPTKYYFYLEFK